MPAMMERIGAFTIQRELGRGGMGVVYLATDTRLDRQVAIKALPAELASDPARLERFEREAKTLASLSHPNLAGIHGVEEQDGAKYLVLEYVEGESLADRLDRGPLAIDDAVELAIGIASGLEAAHAAGVVHRDVKPANINITPDGIAKVLDFGLARGENTSHFSAGGLDSPTLTTPQPQHSPTIEGAILGTAAYMSPEQARGRRVDTRTDTWSFGVVLYEMLVGIGPFHGETATDSIGAILHKEIDVSLLPANTPKMLLHVIRRCLERDKIKRLQAIGDARVELEEIARRLEAGEVDTVDTAPVGRTSRFWPALCALLALGLVAAIGWIVRPVPNINGAIEVPGATKRLVVGSVAQVSDLTGMEQDPALSPDGKTMLFVASEGGDLDIFRMRVGGSNPVNLTPDSPEDDFDPAFSPDGERIVFASTREGGGLFLMGATGENPRRVSDDGYDPAWSPDGRSLVLTTERVVNPYGRTGLGELWVLDLDSKQKRHIETNDPAKPTDGSADQNDAVEPAWSPDGKRIAFWRVTGGQRDLFSVSAQGGDHVAVTSDAFTDWNPVWSSDSRTILFASDRGGQPGLWSIAIDAEGRPEGEPVAVMPGPFLAGEFAIASQTDQLLTAVVSVRASVDRTAFDAEAERFTGVPEIVFASSSYIIQPSVDPAGKWIAFRDNAPAEDIYIIRTDGTGKRRLTEGLSKDRGPTWSADGESITFYSNRNGNYEVWQMRRDGSGSRVVSGESSQSLATPVWTPDGKIMAASWMIAGTHTVLFDCSEDGTLTRRGELIDGFTNPVSCSPDGKRLLGLMRKSDGGLALATCEIDGGAIVPLASPIANEILSGNYFGSCWLDGTRLIAWDTDEQRAFITDVALSEARWIDCPLRGTIGFFSYTGEGELYILRNNEDADLWLVDLDTEAE